MCGIIGQIRQHGSIDRTVFIRMRDTLTHRGPDAADARFFAEETIALGHRRLSFLDLSEAGKQPMCNEDETVWITLNGEIYNYIELRSLLLEKGHTFKTQTDTEVIIHGYEEWGVNIINKLKGMFAFGLLDLRRRKLLLVRDRFGIKPLYYTHFDGQLIFASELKAIVECDDVKREMDMSSFADYFVYRYIPSPKTIWKNISKLPPAHYLTFDYADQTSELVEYWKINFSSYPENEKTLIEEVDHMLETSVAIHARSDVPSGSFLSGGYDSSAVVYYLSKLGYRPDTFSIGFKGWENSEDQYAKIVSDHFHVPLTSLVVDDSNLDMMGMMAEVYDEPIADISILPTWLVSHSAVKKVKAVMSGEGADELFGGYSWQKKFFADQHSRSLFQKLFSDLSQRKADDTLAFYADAMAMGRFDRDELEQLLHPSQHRYIADDTDWFYRKNLDASLSPLKRIQRMDIKCFMGELVLTKIDRASMANSLEVRVPFLDHELFEKVLSVKEEVYFKQDVTKYLLYENIKNHLPREVLTRSKQGFVGPDSFYMNIGRYKSILDNATLCRDGLIRKEYYIQLLARSDHWRLWKLAVMELWYKRWVAKA
jgi:asparagine synthase (glutamine-hydrolysing)